MDKEILTTPVPGKELQKLIDQANEIYKQNFTNETWFGRCIFLSWYCELGTCKFCFRSVSSKKIKDPSKAKRSLESVLAEAMLIKGMSWRIEFLTGGLGILNEEEILRTTKLVSQILKEPIWINLGEVGSKMLDEFKPFVGGIVSSIETVEPKLHKKVCPDKPIEPYVEMMKSAKEKGFNLSMTFLVGLGEKKEDFTLLKKFIENNYIDRITIYALRPVSETIFTKGPKSVDVAWWTAKTRIAFPNIEIIVGSAKYRIPEISLMLKAGANAITKLPATNLFNTDKAREIEEEFKKANRTTKSKFSSPDTYKEADWEGMLEGVDITAEEKEQVMLKLRLYLDSMNSKLEK